LLSKKVKPGATLKLRYDEKENIIVVKWVIF
jgi:ribosomal 50S subunit-recycling heat shock protein